MGGSFPFHYLGIPMAASRLRGAGYSPLTDKIADLVKAWTLLTFSLLVVYISYPGNCYRPHRRIVPCVPMGIESGSCCLERSLSTQRRSWTGIIGPPLVE